MLHEHRCPVLRGVTEDGHAMAPFRGASAKRRRRLHPRLATSSLSAEPSVTSDMIHNSRLSRPHSPIGILDAMLTVQVGRGRESQILRDCLDRLCDGSGGSIFVQGSAGMGKTCLVEALTEEATQRGVAVCTGRAHPEEQ